MTTAAMLIVVAAGVIGVYGISRQDQRSPVAYTPNGSLSFSGALSVPKRGSAFVQAADHICVNSIEQWFKSSAAVHAQPQTIIRLGAEALANTARGLGALHPPAALASTLTAYRNALRVQSRLGLSEARASNYRTSIVANTQAMTASKAQGRQLAQRLGLTNCFDTHLTFAHPA